MRVATEALRRAETNAQAAIVNESITRKRVEALEELLRRPFWGRLRWLVTGR